MLPGPQQVAMAAALADDAHVEEQRERYAARRAMLRRALEAAGFRIDHSEASLYLWATRGEDCWQTVDDLADLGILVAPGAFYGAAGREHVRVALTVTDERAGAAPSGWQRPLSRPDKALTSSSVKARVKATVKGPVKGPVKARPRDQCPECAEPISADRGHADIGSSPEFTGKCAEQELRRPPPRRAPQSCEETCASLSRPRRRTGRAPRSGAQPAGPARGRR